MTLNNGISTTNKLVNQGKAAFEKLWGRRENTDNWQRSNKTVVGTNTNKQNAVGQENNDTTDVIDMDSPTDPFLI